MCSGNPQGGRKVGNGSGSLAIPYPTKFTCSLVLSPAVQQRIPHPTHSNYLSGLSLNGLTQGLHDKSTAKDGSACCTCLPASLCCSATKLGEVGELKPSHEVDSRMGQLHRRRALSFVQKAHTASHAVHIYCEKGVCESKGKESV